MILEFAGLAAFVTVAGAGLAGLAMNLDEERRSDESKGAITFAQGSLATLSALVLGLLINGANDHHRTQGARMTQLVSGVLILDRHLIDYGPESHAARQSLLHAAEEAEAQIWGVGEHRSLFRANPGVLAAILALQPATPQQAFLQQQSLQQLMEMFRGISSLLTADQGIDSRDLLIATVVVWYALLFFAMGLFARPNIMGVAAVLVGSMAVASAVLMVVELDRPFDGLFRISSDPLHAAIAVMRAH